MSLNKVVRRIILSGTLILVIAGSVFSRNHQQFRYDPNSWLYYGKDMRDYATIEPYLLSLGIKRSDRVISLADDSPNIALYFMNVKGWHMSRTINDEEILNAMKNGAQYFITNDSLQLKRERIKPFLSEKLGSFFNVQIFKIQKKIETE